MKNLIAVSLFGIISTLFADTKPLCVKEYKKLQLGELMSVGNAHYSKDVLVEGFGFHGYECPPCPRGAVCGPCPPNFFVVSDDPERCKESVKFANSDTESCPGELVVPYPIRSQFSSKDWPKGARVQVAVRVEQHFSFRDIVTPEIRKREKEQFEQNKKWGDALKESLKKNPDLKPSKRPEWLKDLPGDSYEFKK